MNETQIREVNNMISRWRRALLSATSKEEKLEIEEIIIELEENLENDRRVRHQNR